MPAISPGDKWSSVDDFALGSDGCDESEGDESGFKLVSEDEKVSTMSLDCDMIVLSAGAEIPPDVGFAWKSFPSSLLVVGE